MTTSAVFFDVDFTLIHPGPTFGGEGYRRFAARHGLAVDPARFAAAIVSAAVELDRAQDDVHRQELFVAYARRVLREMGAAGPAPAFDACAREICDEWAGCRHFALYDDVRPALRALHGAGKRIGLISNTHRCLTTFQEHFDLRPYVNGAVSSSDHGYMKPHPSIFREAMRIVGAAPAESVMVGDSIVHDVEGARRTGMRGVLLMRSAASPRTAAGAAPADIPVIRTLAELPRVL